LDQSLSVILPVHNAETTLARQIHELLEVLPELTSRFEVLIVDDGSTDHTEEVAYDLAREFPQLQVARHARRRGAVGAVETGLEHASGEILLVSDERAPLSCGELRRLWGQRKTEDSAKAESPSRRGSRDANLIERLVAWGIALEDARSSAAGPAEGIRMIRRRKLET
jgi:glycosyltransferase involved in cell wall biosynthesis